MPEACDGDRRLAPIQTCLTDDKQIKWQLARLTRCCYGAQSKLIVSFVRKIQHKGMISQSFEKANLFVDFTVLIECSAPKVSQIRTPSHEMKNSLRFRIIDQASLQCEVCDGETQLMLGARCNQALQQFH